MVCDDPWSVANRRSILISKVSTQVPAFWHQGEQEGILFLRSGRNFPIAKVYHFNTVKYSVFSHRLTIPASTGDTQIFNSLNHKY